jgi:hypothetical protein
MRTKLLTPTGGEQRGSEDPPLQVPLQNYPLNISLDLQLTSLPPHLYGKTKMNYADRCLPA